MEAQLQQHHARVSGSVTIAIALAAALALGAGVGYGVGTSARMQIAPASLDKPSAGSVWIDEWRDRVAPSDDFVSGDVATRAGDDWAFESSTADAAARGGVQTSHAEATDASESQPTIVDDSLPTDGLPDLFGHGPR